MTSRRKTGYMRHLRTSDQGKTSPLWESQYLLKPGSAHFFDHGNGWATCRAGGILIPGRREPIGGQSGGKGTTYDPPKKSATRAAENAPSHICDELVNHQGSLFPT